MNAKNAQNRAPSLPSMGLIQVKGVYHNMPVIFHQEDGKTVKITPGSFCPRCQDTRYRIIDEGFIECHQCGRCYFVPSQQHIDAISAREHGTPH